MEISLINVEEKIVIVKGQQVIIDRDVALLYNVQTKEINQAVKNNPNKFPSGYIIELDKNEIENLMSKNSFTNLAMTRVNPKAFTERGLYMLATILKSKKATETTIAIVETFVKMRELSRTVAGLSTVTEVKKQKELMQKSGEIMADILGENLKTTDTETTIELNFAVLKLKHTITRKDNKKKK